MSDARHIPPRAPLRNLIQAYSVLEGDAPVIAESIRDEMAIRLAVMLDVGLSCDAAYTIFTVLPRKMLEDALADHGPRPFRDLVSVSAPAFPQAKVLPTGFGALSKAALSRLVELGFPYDDTVGASGAKLWLTRGAAFGEAAFRKRHPRKNPVMSYWENNGLRLPCDGLCAEGVTMVADQIRAMQGNRVTRAFSDMVRNRPVEPRVLLAFLASGPDYPDCLNDRLLWRKSLNADHTDALAELFCPNYSRHAELARQVRLAAGPSVEDILSRDRLPATIHDLFPHPQPA